MKKKTITNLIMIVAILLIVATGAISAMVIQGQFDTDDGTAAILDNIRGVIDLQRDGVSFPATNQTVLRTGDQLSCQSGATASIRFQDNWISIGEKASITILDPAVDSFSVKILLGEIFAHCSTGISIYTNEKEISFHNSSALFTVHEGKLSVSVLRGTVDGTAAGNIAHYSDASKSTTELTLNNISEFGIAQIKSLNDSSLFFTKEDFNIFEEDRKQALEELINGIPNPTTSQPEPDVQPVTTFPTENTVPDETDPPSFETEPEEIMTSPVTTQPPATEPAGPTPSPAANSCTIAIYCDTILNNYDDLEPGKAEFVPSDGIILMPVTVNFSEGETVFDVLKRVCDRVGIQLEYSWTPLYNSYYVEGIHNLYEFDCGFESGWMYKVNGWFPNYGCSSYLLKDGDMIVWCYTCEGLGTDVGAPRME